jgi:hypothetical protein
MMEFHILLNSKITDNIYKLKPPIHKFIQNYTLYVSRGYSENFELNKD